MCNDRRAFVGMTFEGKRGLEIGPHCRPRVSKAESEVYYVDHLTTEQLRVKYANDSNTILDKLVTVDIVADGRPLRELVADKLPLDYVVASHVVEHVPDLIGWLKDIWSCLAPGGILAMWAPDKRFTFDLFRPLSRREEIAAAYLERRTRPGLRCIMDHFAGVVNVECWYLWEDYTVARDSQYAHSPIFLEIAARDYAAGSHIDCHSWVFTPWHFLTLMDWMTKEYGLAFDLKYFCTTQYHDLSFFFQLQRPLDDIPKTDWSAEAEEQRRTALWPPNAEMVRAQLGLAM
jgi:hypothetical protein